MNSSHDPKLRLAIASIFKNEASYILEWIAFHRAIGINQFFIADNKSDDGSSELLAALDAAGIVHCIPFPYVAGEAPQLLAYAEILRRHSKDADWIAFIDADEFILPTDSERSILAFMQELDRHPQVAAVVLNWATFGSSGHREDASGFVVERFTLRGQQEWETNNHYKSIVRTSGVLGTGENPHHFRLKQGLKSVHTNGKAVVDHNRGPGLSEDVVWDGFRVNHYVVKSWQEFMTRKRPRGRATTSELRPELFFEEHDRNDVDDPMPEWLVDATTAEFQKLKSLISPQVEKWMHAVSAVSDGQGAPYRSEPNEPITQPSIDRTSLKVIRGAVDTLTWEGLRLTVNGWALNVDGSELRYLIPCIGSHIIESAKLQRIERQDVIDQMPDATLMCGYSLSFSLRDIPECALDSRYLTVLAGNSPTPILFQVSSVEKKWLPSFDLDDASSISSASRGQDFIAETKLLTSRPELDVIFDVGANTGQTIKLLKRDIPKCKIYAFEPVKSTFDRLIENVSAFSDVICFNLAVGKESNTQVQIESNPLSVDNRIFRGTPSAPFETVTTISGADFCIDYGIKYIDFLKIDTEGYDLEVLEGFRRMFYAGKIGFVQIECGMNIYNRKHVNISQILDFFRDLPYSMFGIYEQVRELDSGVPLRRANLVMASSSFT